MRDRRERFVALAEARTDRALEAIRLLGNLSNRSNYEYTQADVSQILRALDSEIKSLRSRFAEVDGGPDRSFRLKTPAKNETKTETENSEDS